MQVGKKHKTPRGHRLGTRLARAKIRARLARVEIGNFGDCKPLREGVQELRIDHGPGYRVDVSLHGLRRSFKSLTEWLEIPAGVVAQIMGHKPSATAEKHYTVRPLDLLRVHHERIEAWILEQARVPFVADAHPGKLALVVA